MWSLANLDLGYRYDLLTFFTEFVTRYVVQSILTEHDFAEKDTQKINRDELKIIQWLRRLLKLLLPDEDGDVCYHIAYR